MIPKKYDDDVISHHGSLPGDTISWRRKGHSCSLRQHSHQLAELDPGMDATQPCPDMQKPRFNTSFHNFRYIVVMMGGLSVALMVQMRFNITVAIINMVNQTALYMDEHPNRTIEDFLDEGYSLGGEFDWSNEIQQMIMSWYMIGYTLPQVAGTKLGMKIGSKWTAPISLSICAISTLITPTAAYWGWQWMIGLRLLNGLGGTAVLPMMLHLIEHWLPLEEFSIGLSIAQLIQAIFLAANPIICGYLSAISWIYAFYVPGICALLFSILWLLLVTDRPDESPLVSQKELDLICGCAANQVQAASQDGKSSKDSDGEDLKKTEAAHQSANYDGTLLDVLQSPAFYAYLVIWVFLCSSHVIFAFILPTYLRQFLKIDVASNGTYCSIIFSGTLIAAAWPHPFLRLLQTKFNLSMTVSRRLLHAVICFAVGGTWIYVGLFHTDQLVILFLNRCFQNSNDIIVTGTIMSNYSKAGLSSLVFSMVNTVGNLSIVFASPLAGYVLDYTGQSEAGWSGIYYVLGASQLIMLLAFVTMIKSEPVQFNKRKNKILSIESSNGKFDARAPDGRFSAQTVVIDKLNDPMGNNFCTSNEVKKVNSYDSSDNGLVMKI